MQDRFKYRAVLKTDRFVIIVPTDNICETGYQIDTNIAQKIFEDKYPDNCFFSDFLEIIEKQEYINQYSFDCDLLITNDFTNLMQCTSKKDKNGKLIYEGDIVKRTKFKNGNISIGKVIYCEDEARYKILISDNDKYSYKDYTKIVNLYDVAYHLEIIGNTYENPELLEENQ